MLRLRSWTHSYYLRKIGYHNPISVGQTASRRFLEMWSGVLRWENLLWLPRFPSEWCQHYLFPRFPLLGQWNPLFSWNLNIQQQYAFGFHTKPRMPEPSRGNKGRPATCHVFHRALRRGTMKLELNLWAEISWNSTGRMQHCVSAPSTRFSLRKRKCERPSLCCVRQDSVFTNQLWSTGSAFALEHNREGTTKNFKDQTSHCSSSPLVCLFFFFGRHQSLPFAVVLFLHWKLCVYHRVPPSFHSAAVWQCNFFNYLFLIRGGRGRTPVS